VRPAAEAVFDSLRELESPRQIELEFGIGISGSFGAFIASTQADVGFKVKLIWGVILGALGLVMILSDGIEAVRSIIALGAMPFVFIVLLLVVCLLKALKAERLESS